MLAQSFTTINNHPRDVQIASLGTNTTVFRSRTWERLKFEVEYALQKGTTANSYLIQANQTALIDPPGESFTRIFLEELEQQFDLSKLDYLILGHVNPNRLATLKVLLQKCPQVNLICTKTAANILKASVPDWQSKMRIVKSEDTLDLGQGHLLQFLWVPTPRWPDQLLTYDPQTRILYTDKLFGVHLCHDHLFDEDWKQLDSDRRYYFDCLHAAQSKQIERILDKIAVFPARYYAPNHGSIVRYSLSRFTYDYRQWCQQQKSQSLKVALLYASAYGNTAIVANAIAQELIANGLGVELLNCEEATAELIARAIEECDGFMIGSPTLGGHAPIQIQTALGIVLASASKTKLAGVFGSYGWSGEAIDMITAKLRDANYPFGFTPLRIRFTPDEAALKQAQEAGFEFAQTLKKKQQQRISLQRITEANIDRTEQAVGRLIGSLCVITTHQEGKHQGFLTSWVSQSSFYPPGLMIAISQKQWEISCLAIGQSFVLNILKEGLNVRKHFSKDNQVDPFGELLTKTGANDCLILTEALAYLECTIQQRLATGDHWLVYATVNQGEVLSPEGVTAIQHRKSGRQ